MAADRRFAQDTKVPAGQSQSEVKAALRKAGADRISIFESSERSSVGFTLADRMYRLVVPITQAAADVAQDERRAWRLLGLLLKAKLEAVREGATTIEREFLADMLMPDGSTVGELASRQIAIAYESGKLPDQLLIAGPSNG